MRRGSDPPPTVVSRLAAICLSLPETYQEDAWTGVRWRVRKGTFAHVLTVEDGWPPAYAKAAGEAGPLCVVTFRSAVAALDPRHYAEPPFFRPVWFPDIVGLRLSEGADWDELAGLLAGSYRLLAPLRLSRRLDSAAAQND